MNFNTYPPLEYRTQTSKCTTDIVNTKRPRPESKDAENLPTKLFKKINPTERTLKENRAPIAHCHKVTPLKKYHNKVIKACKSHGVALAKYDEFMNDFNLGRSIKVPKITIAMLEKAVTENNCDMLRIFKELGADLNLSSLNGNFPLLQAVDENRIEMIKLLLELNADPNQISSDNETTPLIKAVYRKNIDTINLLVQNGADLNLKSLSNTTPLVNAIFYKDLALVKSLIDLGADINHFSGSGSTPLTEAVYNNCTEVIRFLLESGADVNLPDGEGNPPLLYAIQGSYRQSTELLEQHGANRCNAQEAMRRNTLGNIWGLEGISTFEWIDPTTKKNYTYPVELEGCSPCYFMFIFTHCINSFFKSISHDTPLLSKEIEGLVKRGINISFDLFQAKPRKILLQIGRNIPFVILGGSKEHVVSIIIYNNTLTIFNRGDGAQELAAISYCLPSSNITPSLISNLKKTYNNMNEFKNVINSLNLEFVGGFSQEYSKTDNCPWASLKGALKVILLALTDEETAKQIYKQFTNFVRERSLDEYLRTSTLIGQDLIKKIQDKLDKKTGFLQSKALLTTKKSTERL